MRKLLMASTLLLFGATESSPRPRLGKPRRSASNPNKANEMTKACVIAATATVTANVEIGIEEEMTKGDGTSGKVIANTATGIVVTEIAGIGIAVSASGTMTAITVDVARAFVSKTKMAISTAGITKVLNIK